MWFFGRYKGLEQRLMRLEGTIKILSRSITQEYATQALRAQAQRIVWVERQSGNDDAWEVVNLHVSAKELRKEFEIMAEFFRSLNLEALSNYKAYLLPEDSSATQVR